MVVVGGGDDNGVDFLGHFIEQLAIVKELGRFGPLLQLRGQVIFVAVAQGDNLSDVAGLVDVARTLAAHADAGDADLARGIVGGADGGQLVGRHEVAKGRGRGAEEPTAINRMIQLVGHGRDTPEMGRNVGWLVV